MSRTKRDITYAKYFTSPKTQNYKKGLLYTRQEIKEELGNKYLVGNNKSHKKLVSSWDDRHISARSEVVPPHEYMERIYLKEFDNDYWYLSVQFNPFKNRYEISRHYNSNEKSYYARFCIKYKNTKYPVVIYPHNWHY